MENISRIKEKCVGCKSCEQSCPKHCISMVENKEGFWYPSVDEKSCIECKVCLKKCPVENTEFHRNEPHRVWAWRNKNDVDIMRSASGGAADSAAKTILQMGGVVYGAAYDEQLAVSHIEVTDEAERENLQSSKYVQSDPKDSYTKVKQRLSEGKTVLFTGTPCQIAGLYAFLGGNPENLYTVDLICHGVPSPKFFKKYLEYQNKQTAGRVIYFNFRSKDKRGWGTQYLLKTKTKTKTKTLSLDRYAWDSICDWGPTAMLPIFNILGNGYKTKNIVSHIDDEGHDQFTKITFLYDHAVASATVAKGVKSEGELIVSGTKGYIYVPAPWWKTDYFEIRYEEASQNKRYFYQLDGEGIRYELVAFTRAIESGRNLSYVDSNVSNRICEVVGDFYAQKDCAMI